MPFADDLMKEKLETLDGSRGRDRSLSAVRVADMTALLEVPAQLRSRKAAGDPPTVAEFNALVADLHALHAVLQRMSTELQKKVLP